MKTTIVLGVLVVLLVLVWTLLRTSTSPKPVPDGMPTAAPESRQVAEGKRARPVASGVTLPAQPTHVIAPAAVEAEIDSDRRNEALERVAKSISGAELAATLDALTRDSGPEAAELRHLLVRRWAESDAPAAAAWASRLPEGQVGRDALEQVAIVWANTALPAAADWVSSLPEGDRKQVATFGVAYEAARFEPVKALELTGTLPPTRERDDLLVHAVGQWAGTDSASASTWAMEVSDPALRQRLVASVAIVLAEQDPVAAATLAVNSLEAGEEQDRVVISIVQRWVQFSPQAAASWVLHFPDNPLRIAAVQNLLALWTAQDAEAAGRWLHELPAGPMRDAGIVAHAQALEDRDWTTSSGTPAGGE